MSWKLKENESCEKVARIMDLNRVKIIGEFYYNSLKFWYNVKNDKKMNNGNLNVLAKDIYQAMKEKGFWDHERNVGEMLMLATGELAEGLEALRKGRKMDQDRLMGYLEQGDQIHREGGFAYDAFESQIKDTFEDELADALIRILDMCGGLGIDIEFHVREKLQYNSLRAHKHGKKF
jgi:NTP pyrophosphatase (non-canonical NTP hydrolase)